MSEGDMRIGRRHTSRITIHPWKTSDYRMDVIYVHTPKSLIRGHTVNRAQLSPWICRGVSSF